MKKQAPPPSLSRDFVALTAGVILLLFIISSWLTFSTYSNYSDRVAADLEQDSLRLENAIISEMKGASYLLSALGQQISADNNRDLTKLALTLRSYDHKGYLYSIFSWVSPEHKILVSSNKGVLEKPVDISDRDYIRDSASEPWKMHIGNPIQGRVSERYVIPVAMGISDNTGKFIGTIMLSIDIAVISERLKAVVSNYGVSFAIVNSDFIPVLENSTDAEFLNKVYPVQRVKDSHPEVSPSGVLKEGNIVSGSGRYFYYRAVTGFPYIALLAYDLYYSDQFIKNILLSRILQIFVIAAFFIVFLWAMRARLLGPIVLLSESAAAMTRGETYRQTVVKGPEEIRILSSQLSRLSDYIAEGKRIEDELRNKVFMLKKAKERAETSMHSKSEFLAYVCQEMRSVLNHIIGFSQAMRDQLHGPIENKKYRSYATDIYSIANTLLGYTQDLLTFSKTETGYTVLLEKPVNIEEITEKSLLFMQDRIHAEHRNIEIRIEDSMPRLVADEFRLQQILTNLLSYACHSMPADTQIVLEAFVIKEGKDKGYLTLVLRSDVTPSMTHSELSSWADRLAASGTQSPSPIRVTDNTPKGAMELNLELIRALVHLHQGHVGLQAGNNGIMAIFFPRARLYMPESE